MLTFWKSHSKAQTKVSCTLNNDCSLRKEVIAVLCCQLSIVEILLLVNWSSKVPLVVPWSSLASPPRPPKTLVVEVGVPPPVLPFLAPRLAGLSSLIRMRTRTTLTSRRWNLSVVEWTYLSCMMLVPPSRKPSLYLEVMIHPIVLGICPSFLFLWTHGWNFDLKCSITTWISVFLFSFTWCFADWLLPIFGMHASLPPGLNSSIVRAVSGRPPPYPATIKQDQALKEGEQEQLFVLTQVFMLCV